MADLDFCYARDDQQQYRRQHKPVPGKYDGQPIMTCAWCGVTLSEEEPFRRLLHREQARADDKGASH